MKSHGDRLTHGQVNYARDDKEWEGKDHNDLLSVIKEVKPHVPDWRFHKAKGLH